MCMCTVMHPPTGLCHFWRVCKSLWFFSLLHDGQDPAHTSTLTLSVLVVLLYLANILLRNGSELPVFPDADEVCHPTTTAFLYTGSWESSSPNSSSTAVKTPPMALHIFTTGLGDLSQVLDTSVFIAWISVSQVTSELKYFDCCIWHQ